MKRKQQGPKLMTPTGRPVGAFLPVKPVERTDDTELYRRPDYDGAELKPFTGRPGAMDAYSLPSRGIK